MQPPLLVEHFFRHEYGKLVASLTRRLGAQHLEVVEDAAQSALTTALESWRVSGPPDNPSAWLFRVAHLNALGELRSRSARRQILERAAESTSSVAAAEEPKGLLANEVPDDLLRMLFVCCDEALPLTSRLMLSLKTLCGFGVSEIALRLFTSEANVYKRLGRARAQLRTASPCVNDLRSAQVAARVPAVQKVLYLLFTEGYLSADEEISIQHELCSEAIRLGSLLAEYSVGSTPETAALLALMHLQVARMASRADACGGLLLLEEQDRSRWDHASIVTGLSWLSKSARGDVYSRYHAEAAIAAEHCLAPSFAQTCWQRVVESYALLETVAPSPLHTLNRAVALAEWKGPRAGLSLLEGFEPPAWLSGSYMWSAVLSDLHHRCGHRELAQRHRAVALSSAPTEAVRTLLQRRLTSDEQC